MFSLKLLTKAKQSCTSCEFNNRPLLGIIFFMDLICGRGRKIFVNYCSEVARRCANLQPVTLAGLITESFFIFSCFEPSGDLDLEM